MPEQTTTNNDIKKAIIDAYFDYFEAYTQRDWNRMISRFSKNITMIGTGIDEYASNREKVLELFSREFEQAPLEVECHIQKVDVQMVCEGAAYLTILMEMMAGPNAEVSHTLNNRTTALMVWEDNAWKLAHGHWSEPSEWQKEGESWPYKVLEEKNRILQEKVLERTKEIDRQNSELKKLNDIKTRLLSIISHDLRSPFNAFMGLTEIMLLTFERNFENPDYFKSRLQLINERAQSLYLVTDNLLNWAKAQSDEIVINFAQIELKDIVLQQMEILRDVAQNKEIEFKLNIPESLTFISDSDVVSIIIRNILSNAIKYSYHNSSIIIDTIEEFHQIKIVISDFGTGMKPERAEQLQNAIILNSAPGTDEERGSGFGIQLCNTLLSKIGGKLQFKSELGKGTKVTVILPLKTL